MFHCTTVLHCTFYIVWNLKRVIFIKQHFMSMYEFSFLSPPHTVPLLLYFSYDQRQQTIIIQFERIRTNIWVMIYEMQSLLYLWLPLLVTQRDSMEAGRDQIPEPTGGMLAAGWSWSKGTQQRWQQVSSSNYSWVWSTLITIMDVGLNVLVSLTLISSHQPFRVTRSEAAW